jgi:hypothetical protein
MLMQALNQLVARSIVDPSVVEAFSAGRIGDVLTELGFVGELNTRLSAISADTFAEYAVCAYRVVKQEENGRKASRLPSPAEGLMVDKRGIDQEQVA